MNILGIFNGIDAGATLSIDGKIVGAIQEERLTREKFIVAYPFQSIEYLLKSNNLKYKDIDIVSLGAFSYPHQDTILHYFNAIEKNGYDTYIASERMFNSLKQDFKFRDEFYQKTFSLFGSVKIEFYDHHYSHACTAFYASPFDDTFVITADGRGDLQSIVIWKANRADGLKRIKTFSELFSLGMMYSQITAFLGFKPHRHEGKITGLAAYGKKTKLVDELEKYFLFENGEFVNKHSKEYKPYLSSDLLWLNNIAKEYSKEDVAYAAQHLLEKVILQLVKHYIPANALLTLAGGIFANVKLNQRIREECGLQDYFIFPAMGDGGISYGACIASNVHNDINKDFTIDNMYTGNGDFNWKQYLKNEKYTFLAYKDNKDLVKKAVELLINNKILGLFTEKMEYGPRALGARSILISTADREINKTVNERLNRTEFMPFAPVTLESEASKMYTEFTSDINTNFMTTCYSCTEKMQKLSPAVVHVDNTARPQIINEHNSTQLYFKILKEYFGQTGIPSLVNTSFNNHEEPIVCTEHDALDSLEKGNIDYIVTNNYLIYLT